MLRRAFVVSMWLFTAWVQAQGVLGTKTESIPSAGGSGAGLMPFFQLLVAVGIVFALLRFVAPKLLAKFNKRLVTTGGIQIEESAAFAGGNLYVVTARGKSLLLSVSSGGVACLADLTTATPEAPKEEPVTFMEILERAEDLGGDDALLEDVQQMIERNDSIEQAVVEVQEFKTRLPEDTKPLPPLSPEPWQPRTLDPSEALDRLGRLSS
jgi:hypothetical protein